MGIDGFRADAIPYLIEEEGTNRENLPGRTTSWSGCGHGRRGVPGRVLLAEANQSRTRSGVLRHRGGPRVPHALPLPDDAADLLRMRDQKAGAITDIMPTPRRSRPAASGAPSCATTTSSPSRWCPPRSARRCTAGTRPTRGCAPTSASAAGWPPCWTTPARRSSSRTRCCCPCPAARACTTATRSGWATTLAAGPRRGAHPDAVDPGPQRRVLHHVRPGQALPARGPVAGPHLHGGQR